MKKISTAILIFVASSNQMYGMDTTQQAVVVMPSPHLNEVTALQYFGPITQKTSKVLIAIGKNFVQVVPPIAKLGILYGIACFIDPKPNAN